MTRIGVIKGNILTLNLIALAILAAIYVFIYKGIWQMSSPAWTSHVHALVWIVGAFSLIIVHELIHWICAVKFVGRGKARLHMHLLVWECRVKQFMTRDQYILYALAPGIALGLLGLIIYYLFPSQGAKFIGALLFLAGFASGGGDYWFVFQIFKYPRNTLIRDNGTAMEVYTPS